MKIFNKLSAITISLMFALTLLVTAPLVFANPKDAVCDGANLTGTSSTPGGSGCSAGTTDINGTITWVVNVLSVVVGITAVIMIIIAGFKYVTSTGDSGNTASAKNTIIYAIVGLVVVAMAQIIVRFVIHKSKPATAQVDNYKLTRLEIAPKS